MRSEKKNTLAKKRHWRVRKKVIGTPERPRMSVKFSGTHIYVQFVDDSVGRTLAAVSTRDKNAPKDVRGANVANATLTGKRAAEAAQKLGERLLDLREPDLVALNLPEELLEAVRDARRLGPTPAQARARQYIGKLMRRLDTEPIEHREPLVHLLGEKVVPDR